MNEFEAELVELYDEGYLVKITTWENDAEEIELENVTQASVILQLCELFRHPCFGGFGNAVDIPDGFEDAVEALIKQHHDVFREILVKYWGDASIKRVDFELIADFSTEIGLRGSEFYTRVFDYAEVFYFSKPVFGHKLSSIEVRDHAA